MQSKATQRTRPRGPHDQHREFHAVDPHDVVLDIFSENDLADLNPTTPERVLFRYRKRRPELIYSSAYLENNSYTLPEVRTLLDSGVIAAEKTHEETLEILNLSAASELLEKHLHRGTFQLSPDISNTINSLLVHDLAIDAGLPRSQSKVNQHSNRGAIVQVMGDQFYGYLRDEIDGAIDVMIERIVALDHPVTRAVNYAAFASYAQIYMDGNKRTARHMMDGELMRHGYDAVAIPAREQERYNTVLAAMFRTGELRPYTRFLLRHAKASAASQV